MSPRLALEVIDLSGKRKELFNKRVQPMQARGAGGATVRTRNSLHCLWPQVLPGTCTRAAQPCAGSRSPIQHHSERRALGCRKYHPF